MSLNRTIVLNMQLITHCMCSPPCAALLLDCICLLAGATLQAACIFCQVDTSSARGGGHELAQSTVAEAIICELTLTASNNVAGEGVSLSLLVKRWKRHTVAMHQQLNRCDCLQTHDSRCSICKSMENVVSHVHIVHIIQQPSNKHEPHAIFACRWWRCWTGFTTCWTTWH